MEATGQASVLALRQVNFYTLVFTGQFDLASQPGRWQLLGRCELQHLQFIRGWLIQFIHIAFSDVTVTGGAYAATTTLGHKPFNASVHGGLKQSFPFSRGHIMNGSIDFLHLKLNHANLQKND